MIVVVEGPSAAGKTTWVAAHGGGASVLLEALPAADVPDDPRAAARFWAEHGASRWARALEVERRTGLAVCDTDPLKLHYAWSTWQTGAGTARDFELGVTAYREAVADRRVGFADRYLVSIPEIGVLDARRQADATRRRRNFDVHRRLGEPLRRWYAALETVRPGSVRWGFEPEALVPDSERDPDRDRYRLEDFDALVDRLRAG